jgi:hypothetical protein
MLGQVEASACDPRWWDPTSTRLPRLGKMFKLEPHRVPLPQPAGACLRGPLPLGSQLVPRPASTSGCRLYHHPDHELMPFQRIHFG